MITYIFGAGGHALEVAAVAGRAGMILDNDPNVRFVIADSSDSRRSDLPFPLMTESDLAHHPQGEPMRVILAIGSGHVRSKIDAALVNLGIPVDYPNVIDPTAVMMGPIKAGIGLVAFPFSFVSTRVVIGRHCHLNTGSSICHEVVLGDFVTVSPKGLICGRSRIGDLTFIGANATVIEDVDVAGNSTIGAGSTVLNSLARSGTYVGTPAKLIRG
jgi:sugar O-acyltransferase (sialic acid O-acetyltransferase NeuD family)